jgi:hypothetical protein
MRSTLPREPGFDFLLEGRRSLPVAPGVQSSLASLHESTAARPRMLYYRVYVDTTTTNSGKGRRKEDELRDGTGKERTSYETEDLEEGREEARKGGRQRRPFRTRICIRRHGHLGFGQGASSAVSVRVLQLRTSVRCLDSRWAYLSRCDFGLVGN